MTGNQSSNQSVGLDLLPPRVVEKDTQAEILGASSESVARFMGASEFCLNYRKMTN
jgi:hypothetical protein